MGETGFRSCRSKGCDILCDDGYDGRLVRDLNLAGVRGEDMIGKAFWGGAAPAFGNRSFQNARHHRGACFRRPSTVWLVKP